MENVPMDTGEPVASTSRAANDDDEFEKMLKVTDEQIMEEVDESDNGPDMDPAESLRHQLFQSKRKRAEQDARGQIRKVRKAVVGAKLPSQSSGLCRSIRQFVRFLMGMPQTLGAYPPAPTQEEWDVWNNWALTRYNKMTAHLSAFAEKHKDKGKDLAKQLYQEEVARIRKHLAPPPFKPAPDQLNADLSIPFSVKKSCEQDVQLAGFGRVTFEWDARSFTSSVWNGTLGSIVIKHYYNWARSQPGTIWDETSCMERVLERWVQGQGKDMRKGGVEGKSPEDLKVEKARKATIARMKSKIADKRRTVAFKKMSSIPAFALVFTKETVSDWEDQQPPAKAKRVNPIWRSQALRMCAHKLGEIALTMCTSTAELRSLAKLFERDTEETLQTDFDIHDVPRKLPLDAYDPQFLQSLSAVERDLLEPQASLDLEAKARTLNEMTIPGRSIISQVGRGSVGDLGMGSLAGPSGGKGKFAPRPLQLSSASDVPNHKKRGRTEP